MSQKKQGNENLRLLREGRMRGNIKGITVNQQDKPPVKPIKPPPAPQPQSGDGATQPIPLHRLTVN